MNDSDALKTLVAWVGPTFTFVGLFIAWLNYRQKTQVHKFELYDHRIIFRKAVAHFWADLIRDGYMTSDSVDQFCDIYNPGALLFCKPTREMLGILPEEAKNNGRLYWQYKDLDPGPEKEKALTEFQESFDCLNSVLLPALTRQMANEISPAEALVPYQRVKWWLRRSKARHAGALWAGYPRNPRWFIDNRKTEPPTP